LPKFRIAAKKIQCTNVCFAYIIMLNIITLLILGTEPNFWIVLGLNPHFGCASLKIVGE
jgi:hypothetical protein